MKITNLSLKQQFYLATFGIGFLIVIAAFAFNILSSYNYKKNSFMQESILQAGLIADNSVAPMLFFDKEGTATNLMLLRKYPNILQAIIYDNKDNLFVKYNPDNRDVPIRVESKDSWFSNPQNSRNAFYSDTFIVRQKIEVNGISYGTLYLEKSTGVLSDFLKGSMLNIAIFTLLLMFGMVFFVLKTSQKLIDPILNLSSSLVDLSKSTDYSVRLKHSGRNEIGKLYGAFNHLFESIELHQKSRDEALERATNYQQHLENLTNELEHRVESRTLELQTSLNTLKSAQGQLVESEKMAALGSLVSGVAHEVNTPLGNAITGSSIVKSECKELLKMMGEGTLKKSILEEKLEHLEETSNLLMKSVNTAANLVRSFKQISVDQSIETKRLFNLHEYVKEVLLTFRNKLKQIPVESEILGDPELSIKSYPGSFAQLLNNFIQNSIIHGFEDKKSGAKITINMYIDNDILYFTYEDNGCGIDDSIKDKAFDPFVTTKRNAGGTGLGLNIVYNIVSQKLEGTLELESIKDEGVKFILKIPIKD